MYTCVYFTQIDNILDQCGQCHQPAMTGDGDDWGHFWCTVHDPKCGANPHDPGQIPSKVTIFLSALYSHCLANIFNGHFRNLNWRYLPYIFGLFFRPM